MKLRVFSEKNKRTNIQRNKENRKGNKNKTFRKETHRKNTQSGRRNKSRLGVCRWRPCG